MYKGKHALALATLTRALDNLEGTEHEVGMILASQALRHFLIAANNQEVGGSGAPTTVSRHNIECLNSSGI